MKTTDVGGTVMDEPKTREATAKVAIKPAVDSRSTASKGAVKESMIYIDGKFYTQTNAKVSVFDHGLLYGDGIFEGIRFYNGRVFRLEEHLDRLYDSGKAILLTLPLERDVLREAVLETCRQNHLRDG